MKELVKNKKAEGTDISVVAVIGLVLGALAIASLAGAGNTIYQAVSSGNKDTATANSFERLGDIIEDMAESTSKFDYEEDPFNLGDDKILLGFDYDWEKEKNNMVAKESVNYDVKRPIKCGMQACLCLYQAGGWFDDILDIVNEEIGPYSCRLFKEKIIFLAPHIDKDVTLIHEFGGPKKSASRVNGYPRDVPLNTGYENLCIIADPPGSSEMWYSRNIYIEKTLNKDDEILIFIAARKEILNPTLNERKNKIEEWISAE